MEKGFTNNLISHSPVSPTGTVKLYLEYYIKNDGLAAVTGTFNVTLDLAGKAIWEEIRLNIGTVTSPIIQQGSQIGARLYRFNSDAGTYSSPIAISTWGYHYEIDTIGSRTITAK